MSPATSPYAARAVQTTTASGTGLSLAATTPLLGLAGFKTTVSGSPRSAVTNVGAKPSTLASTSTTASVTSRRKVPSAAERAAASGVWLMPAISLSARAAALSWAKALRVAPARSFPSEESTRPATSARAVVGANTKTSGRTRRRAVRTQAPRKVMGTMIGPPARMLIGRTAPHSIRPNTLETGTPAAVPWFHLWPLRQPGIRRRFRTRTPARRSERRRRADGVARGRRRRRSACPQRSPGGLARRALAAPCLR